MHGCYNGSADIIKRVDEAWSDTNLTTDFSDHRWDGKTFTRLKCRNCNGLHFEVLVTDSYETSARCATCGMYYIVHCG